MRQWHSRRIRRVAAIALVMAQLGFSAAAMAQGTEDIASQLICLCGCGKLLNVCEMDTAKQMKSVISDKLAEGWGKQQVIEYMTATYGEQVLAAPTKKGFNLIAWITPFALILFGTVVICMVVLAWVRHRQGILQTESEVVVSQGLEAKYGAILERELNEFESMK